MSATMGVLALAAAAALSVAAGPAAALGPKPAPSADAKAPPADAAARAPSAATAVAGSSGTAKEPLTVEGLYPIARLRDPFTVVQGGGGASSAKSGAALIPIEEFSIHALTLKGVMEDRTGGFAVLVEPKYGATFVLRRGRLYDSKNKPVPGVTGTVKVKQKRVQLLTPERDMQVLTMGETDAAAEMKGDAKDKP